MASLFLASSSPRRLALLQQIGIHPVVHAVSIDESVQAGETPEAYVERLARGKAEAGRGAVLSDASCCVLGADTAVVLVERLSGKVTAAQAKSAVAAVTKEMAS